MNVELVPREGPAIQSATQRLTQFFRVPLFTGGERTFYRAGVITGRMRATGFHREAVGGRAEAVLESAPDVAVYLERA